MMSDDRGIGGSSGARLWRLLMGEHERAAAAEVTPPSVEKQPPHREHPDHENDRPLAQPSSQRGDRRGAG